MNINNDENVQNNDQDAETKLDEKKLDSNLDDNKLITNSSEDKLIANLNETNLDKSNAEKSKHHKKSTRSNQSVEDYIKSGQFSEKTIQDITMISKKISFDFNESDSEQNSLDDDEKFLSDIDEIIKKHNQENTNSLNTDENSSNSNLPSISNSLDSSSENTTSTISQNQDETNLAENQPVRRRTWYFKSTIYLFLFVFCFTFVSFTYVFNFVLVPVQVIGTSMQPTLNLSVSSGGYYTGNNDEDHCDIVYINKDKRYQNDDIIIVNNNGYVKQTSSQDETSSLIKRVVATEFQTIVFSRNSYSSNESFIIYSVRVFDFNGNYIELDNSYLDNGEMQVYKFLISETSEIKNVYPLFYEIFHTLDTDGTYSYTVPKDHYFVMGDNRNNSIDSRFFGAVKYSDIDGEVKLIVPFGSSILQAIFIKLKSYI